MTDSQEQSDLIHTDAKAREAYFDENFKLAEDELTKAKEALDQAQYVEEVVEKFSGRKDVYIVEGDSRVYIVCPEKLNIKNFSTQRAGLRDGAIYRTFPSVHYFKKKNQRYSPDTRPEAAGMMIIGRQVASFNVYPYRLFIDDASTLFLSKPAGNTNKVFTINKDCPNYVGKFNDNDDQFKKTLAFAKSLDERNPDNTPLWLQNYLILQ